MQHTPCCWRCPLPALSKGSHWPHDHGVLECGWHKWGSGSLMLLTSGMTFKGPLLAAPTLGSTALGLTLGCLLRRMLLCPSTGFVGAAPNSCHNISLTPAAWSPGYLTPMLTPSRVLISGGTGAVSLPGVTPTVPTCPDWAHKPPREAGDTENLRPAEG